MNHLVPVIPDGFLSLGVERFKGDTLRLSYVLWAENAEQQLQALLARLRAAGIDPEQH